MRFVFLFERRPTDSKNFYGYSLVKHNNSRSASEYTRQNRRTMENINDYLIPAARQGNSAIIRELIERSADVNVRNELGHTPLVIACYHGHYEIARLLLAAGANVNASDNGGNTALMGVSFKGYADLAELLIRHGADLNAQHANGGSALMFAVMFGRNAVAKLLLESGADYTLPDIRGLTAADHANQQGNAEAEQLIHAFSIQPAPGGVC